MLPIAVLSAGLVAQLVQLLGALLVLAGFVLAQVGRVQTSSRGYLGVNLLGSAAMAGVAITGRQYGFILLEGSWAIVSALGLARASRSAAGAGRAQ